MKKQTKFYIEVNTKLKKTGVKNNPSFAVALDKKRLKELGFDTDKEVDVVILQND